MTSHEQFWSLNSRKKPTTTRASNFCINFCYFWCGENDTKKTFATVEFCAKKLRLWDFVQFKWIWSWLEKLRTSRLFKKIASPKYSFYKSSVVIDADYKLSFIVYQQWNKLQLLTIALCRLWYELWFPTNNKLVKQPRVKFIWSIAILHCADLTPLPLM